MAASQLSAKQGTRNSNSLLLSKEASSKHSTPDVVAVVVAANQDLEARKILDDLGCKCGNLVMEAFRQSLLLR